MYDFSIVTISFNQADFIRQCIQSVKEQTGVSIQHIVVDAGSTDGSRDIIKSFDSIEYIFEKDNGPADGLNKGFSLATGKILYFLNSDDFLCDNTLKIVKDKFERQKDTDLFFFGGQMVDKNGNKIKSIFPSYFSTCRYVNDATTVFQQGFFFRNHVFQELKFNVENKIAWDGEYIFDCFLRKLKYNRHMIKIANFRVHDTTITSSSSYKDRLNCHYKKIAARNGMYPGTRKKIFYRILKIIADPKYLYYRIIK
jgi:glycosyltransferase involved in cell wall biosynthesis